MWQKIDEIKNRTTADCSPLSCSGSAYRKDFTMSDKVILSLVSVVVGWLLGQGTAIFREYWTSRQLKRGLLEELEDINSQLQRTAMICARHLQVFALRGCDPAVPIPIHGLFFRQYYKDAMHKLNRQQRLSFQLIHSSLESLNKQFDDLASAGRACAGLQGPQYQALLNGAINAWGDVVKAIFFNVRDLQWYVLHHISNKRAPDLSLLGSDHATFLLFKEEAQKEVATILEDARRLKREDFEKVYNETAFAKAGKEVTT